MLFRKLQFLLFNRISTYLPVKSKLKSVSIFGDIEGNNIDISADFPPTSLPRIYKSFFKTFLLYNFEPVRLNDTVFIRSSKCLWSLLMTSSSVSRMEGTGLSSTHGLKRVVIQFRVAACSGWRNFYWKVRRPDVLLQTPIGGSSYFSYGPYNLIVPSSE
jgi:hypothetical protein